MRIARSVRLPPALHAETADANQAGIRYQSRNNVIDGKSTRSATRTKSEATK